MSGLAFCLVLIAGALIGAGICYGICEHRNRQWAPDPKPEAHELWHEMVRVVEASLLENHDEWSSDGYYLRNQKRGFAIWVANQDYGLGFNVGGTGGDIPLSKEDKASLWRVVQARTAAAVVDRFRNKPS